MSGMFIVAVIIVIAYWAYSSAKEEHRKHQEGVVDKEKPEIKKEDAFDEKDWEERFRVSGKE